MPYSQANRPMKLTTPLGPDAMLLVSFQGREAISHLFRFELQTVWTDQTRLLPFDQLLGKKITIEISPSTNKRYLNGIVSRISQGVKDENFTHYTLEVVPQFWLLDRKLNSCTFQHMTIPDILKKLLAGVDVDYKIDGTFEQREYCVQYRETDFAFASRMMEEEGIFYFFKHTASGHQMVLTNSASHHLATTYLPTAVWEDSHATMQEDRVFEWSKGQEIRSGKYTSWDHNFELPDKHLDATKPIQETVPVGTVTHKLKVAGNDSYELYDYPGGYAGRFDGVSKSGGEQASALQKVFTDNGRTVAIRMQEEAVGSILIRGKSSHAGFTSGHTFELSKHFSDNGKYTMTTVEHDAAQPLAVEQVEDGYRYVNWFTCIPFALPFRPARVTPVPHVRGVQSATVVGPPGADDIFPDKYGRVKIQFHWDREGQSDVNSSCWVRVASFWAGTQWGAVHIPRIGQEVLVDFLEGDVNRPIIVGSLYNASNMPTWKLPDKKTVSGIKSRSTPQGSADNFNELSFDDKKGSELVNVQAEKDLKTLVKNDETREVRHDRVTLIKNDETQTVTNNEKITVEKGNQSIEIQTGNQTTDIKQGNQSTTIDMGNQSTTIKMGNQTNKINLGKIETEAMQSIELKVGQSSIKIDQMGVTIKGMMIKIDAQVQCEVHSVITQIKGDAMLMEKGGIVMIN